MEKHIVIKNATVYNSNYTKKTRCNITVEDGIIKKIEEYNPDAITKSENEIDLEGKLILPGFIDSHLHIPRKYFI